MTMIEMSYTVKDEAGMHARPAGKLVKRMQQFQSEITLSRGEKKVSLKKLFALMGLAIKQNETVTIRAEGSDEAEAIEAARSLMETEGL
jgi:phosphocarrier protein